RGGPGRHRGRGPTPVGVLRAIRQRGSGGPGGSGPRMPFPRHPVHPGRQTWRYRIDQDRLRPGLLDRRFPAGGRRRDPLAVSGGGRPCRGRRHRRSPWPASVRSVPALQPRRALVQHARTGAGHPVAAHLAREVAVLIRAERAGGPLGSAGLVVGATIGAAAAELGADLAAVNGPLLAPGLGAQGGTTADLARVFAGALGAVVPTTSRAVLAAGPEATEIADAARRVGGMLKDLRNEANG